MQIDSRGFLADRDIDALRAKMAREPYDRLWDRLTRRTRECIEQSRADGFNVSGGGIGWHSRTPMTLEAALMARLTDDRDALAFIEECIAFLDDYVRHSDDKGKRRHSLMHSHAEIAQSCDMVRDLLGDAARDQLLALMRDHLIDDNAGRAGYMMYHGGGNIFWCHNVQAATCALLFGEDCAHPDWEAVVQHGINHVRTYLKFGCDEHGYSYEGTGYGHGVFNVMYPFVELLQKTGYADLYRTEPRLAAIPEASMQILFPDASFMTNMNDVGLVGGESLPWLLWTAREYNQPAHLGFWLAYQGPDDPVRPYGDMRPWIHQQHDMTGATADMTHSLFYAAVYWDADAPVVPLEAWDRPTATCLHGVEVASYRTSWNRDAIYVNVCGAGRSHMSQTHRHADAGHFAIFAHGDYLAIDTGRYNSDEDQHNVMVVDGENHMGIAPGWGMDKLAGRLIDGHNTPIVRYCRADMAHMKGCYWADRHCLFVSLGGDDAYFVTIDNINKNDQKHHYWWQMQANPDYAFDITGDRTATLRGERARLDMFFAIPDPRDFPSDPHTLSLRHDIKEWHWPYGVGNESTPEKTKLLTSPVRRPRLIADLEGLNGVMTSVIVPRRIDARALKVSQVSEFRIMRVEIETPDFTDTLLAAIDNGFVDIEGYEALAEIAMVRRDRQGNVLATWTVDGSDVKVE